MNFEFCLRSSNIKKSVILFFIYFQRKQFQDSVPVGTNSFSTLVFFIIQYILLKLIFVGIGYLNKLKMCSFKIILNENFNTKLSLALTQAISLKEIDNRVNKICRIFFM